MRKFNKRYHWKDKKQKRPLTKPFSDDFRRQFNGIPIIQEIPENNGDSRRSRSNREVIPGPVRYFISHIWKKYAEYPDAERELIPFSVQRARAFFTHTGRNKDIALTKAYIEYGLYLFSLQGSGFFDKRDFHGWIKYRQKGNDLGPFFAAVREDCSLDFSVLGRVESEFTEGLEASFSGDEEGTLAIKEAGLQKLFRPYIAFRSIPYLNSEGTIAGARMQMAEDMLDEARTKYRIDASNVGKYLRLALRHIEWGLLDPERSNEPNVELTGKKASSYFKRKKPSKGTFYDAGDVFKRLHVDDSPVIFRSLNAEGVNPLFARTDEEEYKCLVEKKGAAALIRYIDSNYTVDYRQMRMKT